MDGHENYDPLLGDVRERRPAPQKQAAADAASAASANEAGREIASQAVNLRDMAGAGFMYWIVSSSMAGELHADAFRIYRDLLLEEAGSPTDPVERMLIEQLALAHFSIGQLRIRSCATEVPKLAMGFADAATRLLGEFRRCSLALEDYRDKQIARKKRSRSGDSAERTEPAVDNGRPRPSRNGQGSTHQKNGTPAKKQESNGHSSEIPQCLLDRMTPPIHDASQPAAATAANGKA